MNKFGSDLLNFIKQWWAVLTIVGTVCAFYYNTQALHPRMTEIERKMASADLVHRELELKINENTSNINITIARLETALSQISNDLTYIKQKLFK